LGNEKRGARFEKRGDPEKVKPRMDWWQRDRLGTRLGIYSHADDEQGFALSAFRKNVMDLTTTRTLFILKGEHWCDKRTYPFTFIERDRAGNRLNDGLMEFCTSFSAQESDISLKHFKKTWRIDERGVCL
jgi:hypothetical protein